MEPESTLTTLLPAPADLSNGAVWRAPLTCWSEISTVDPLTATGHVIVMTLELVSWWVTMHEATLIAVPANASSVLSTVQVFPASSETDWMNLPLPSEPTSRTSRLPTGTVPFGENTDTFCWRKKTSAKRSVGALSGISSSPRRRRHNKP